MPDFDLSPFAGWTGFSGLWPMSDWVHVSESHGLFFVIVVQTIVFVMLFRQNRKRRDRLARIEVALRSTSDKQKSLLMIAENAKDGLVLQQMDATILWANTAYCQFTGWTLDEIVGRKPQEFCLPADLKPSAAEIRDFRFRPDSPEFNSLARWRNIRKNGEEFWVEINQALVEPVPGQEQVVLVCRDVTEQVLREEELERARAELQYTATHDALTGLANRSELLRFTQSILDSPDPRDRAIGILHIDLDRFKQINDTRGHAAGDTILEHVAHSIRAVLRQGDMACRLGGDEFVVVCPGQTQFDPLEVLASRLLEHLRKPVSWGEESLSCSASIGIAMTDDSTSDANALIRNADFALYEAKRPDHAPVACFDAQLHTRRDAENRLTEEFAIALDNDDLEFLHQPIFSPSQNRCIGFETLARWQNAAGTYIEPPRFLELAGRLRRQADVDFAAMRATVDLLAELLPQGFDIQGSFNSSTASLARPDFLSRLDWEVDRKDVARRRLVVEVLETTFFGSGAVESEAAAAISRLKDAGYFVLLDDFGVGYAGLAHLDGLDISGIKIDRSLVMRAAEERTSRMIVSSVIHLADELGLTSLAEGIETQDQADALTAMGCRILQGYAFGRPMPRDAFIAHLRGTAGQGRARA